MNLNTMYFGVINRLGVEENYTSYEQAKQTARDLDGLNATGRFFMYVRKDNGSVVRTDLFDGTVRVFPDEIAVRDEILRKYMQQIVSGVISGKAGAMAALRLLA